MGLGPQICITCKRSFDYVETEEEREEIRKKYPDSDFGAWWCSKCGSTKSQHYALSIKKELFDEIFPRQTAKCLYCDFMYDTSHHENNFFDHLNLKHHKCGVCGVVFDKESEEEWEKHNECYK